ncbi:efflux RND transporter periplasmic adaptor subunit [bacterium]|nr:efflux RND transporter periplasmic adaptor subunit [bacterium]
MRDHSLEMQKTPTRTAASWAFVIGFVLLAVFSLKVFSSFRNSKPKTTASVTPGAVVTVSTARADYVSLPDTVIATGSVAAVDPLEVGSEVNGLRVEQVLVEEGDRVGRGQTLAVLNRSLLEAQLRQAQARYRAGQAQVSRALQPNRPQEVSSLRAAYAQALANATQERSNLKQAQVTYRNLQLTAQRYQKVLGEGFVTIQEAGDRQTEVDRQNFLVSAARQRIQSADFAVEQARQRLLLAQAGGRREDVEIAQASSQEMAGVIAQIEAQLAQTVIVAPDAGLVLKRNVHLGDISSNTKPMFVLARRGELELRAEVTQSDLIKLREGVRATVNYAGKKASGKVWRISPQVDGATRLGYARILLDTGSALRPGMFGEARIEVGQHRALTVPSEALLGEGGDYFVFKLEGTKAVRQPVTTGVRNNQRVEITQGLQPNDSVAVVGARFLSDGDKVEVSDKS